MIRSLSLRPSWLLAPWADQTREAQCPPGLPGLLRPGFQVAGSPRTPAGYNYEAKLRIASAGLSPASTAASLAALRPEVIRRKLSLGSDSKEGAQGMAKMLSVVRTLEVNDIAVVPWLEAWLSACAANGGHPPEDLGPWLPWTMDEARRAEFRA